MNRGIAGVLGVALFSTTVLVGCGGFSEELPDGLKGATYSGVLTSSTPGAAMPVHRTVHFDKEQSMIYIDGNAFKCRVSGREIEVFVPDQVDLWFDISFNDDQFTTLTFEARRSRRAYSEVGVLKRTPF